MLRIDQEREADYRERLRLLNSWGYLQLSSPTPGTKPVTILNRGSFDELSFALFVGWLFLGVHHQRARIALVPFGATGDRSLLVFSRKDTDLAPPGRQGGAWTFLDPDYFACSIDDLVAPAVPPESTRLLCPVVNRARYNLGRSSVNPAAHPAPKKTRDCCDSRKKEFWDYLEATLWTSPGTYGDLVGGTAIPIAVPYSHAEQYLMGTGINSSDLGSLLEETLLLYAGAAAGRSLGYAHANVREPVESFEIDFLLYDDPSCAYAQQSAAPAGGWPGHLASDSMCMFELTQGHMVEHPVAGRPESRPGLDRAKNKVVNLLAMQSLGLRCVQYEYLSVFGTDRITNSTLRKVVRGGGLTDYTYWSLSDSIPDVEALLANHFSAPVSAPTLRSWHQLLVQHVEQRASAFAATLP